MLVVRYGLQPTPFGECVLSLPERGLLHPHGRPVRPVRQQSHPTIERDATYVMNEVRGNETDVAIVEHATDTHSYTNLIFGLFDPLGLEYSPRLRDIGDQKLSCIQGRELSHLGLHFTGHVQPSYNEVRPHDLLR